MSYWRNSRNYRVWRAKVIRRDKVCQVCGSLQDRHAHHKDDASTHMGSRFAVSNGVVLCGSHHRMFHASYKNSYQEPCTEKEYENFIEMIEALREEFKASAIKLIKEIR